MARWPAGWAVSASVLASLLALAAVAPPLRGFFGLRFAPVFALQMLSLAVAWALAEVDARRGLAPFARGLGILAVAFTFQLFGSSVVVFSEPPGCFVLASVPLVVWWFHALLVRPTPRTPLPAIAHVAGMAGALALRPGLTQAVVLLVVLPIGAGGALLLGSLATADARRRRVLSEHRAAIEAQVLEAQASEKERVAASLALLGERRREARALVGAALRDVEDVRALAAALPDGAARGEGLALTRGLRAGLERLESAVDDAGEPAAPRAPLEAVDAARVAGEVVADAARRFPGVAIGLGPETPLASGASALLCGGPESLRLILENLVANACEGDGVAGARAVQLAIARTPGDANARWVDLVVRDDGPGFRADLLAGPVRAFATVKPYGTGLGLYTAASLAAASGGELLRENRAGGGARVTLRLPAAEPAP
jgi:signal transduction histidine kinase